MAILRLGLRFLCARLLRPQRAMQFPFQRPTMPVSAFDDLLFDLDDLHTQHQPQFHWDPYPQDDVKPVYYDYQQQYEIYSPQDDVDLATWINDPELAPSSPIPIPSPSDSVSSYYPESFADPTAFSPTSFAALHPLPRSISPPSTFEDPRAAMRPRVHSVVSPREMSLQTPSWASQLWDAPSALRTQPSILRPSIRHSPLTDATTIRQQRIPIRRASLSSGQLFLSSSAPSHTDIRNYSTRRADSVSVSDDRDATVRRKKRSPDDESPGPSSALPAAAKDGRKFHWFFRCALPHWANNAFLL